LDIDETNDKIDCMGKMINRTASCWSDSDIIHCQIVFGIPEGEHITYTVDNVKYCVRYEKNKKFDKKGWNFWRVGVTEKQEKKMIKLFNKELGKEFAGTRMMFSMICGCKGDRTSWFCSELIMDIFEKSEITEEGEYESSLVTPQRMLSIIKVRLKGSQINKNMELMKTITQCKSNKEMVYTITNN